MTDHPQRNRAVTANNTDLTHLKRAQQMLYDGAFSSIESTRVNKDGSVDMVIDQEKTREKIIAAATAALSLLGDRS